jgi:hypothetical protein
LLRNFAAARGGQGNFFLWAELSSALSKPIRSNHFRKGTTLCYAAPTAVVEPPANCWCGFSAVMMPIQPWSADRRKKFPWPPPSLQQQIMKDEESPSGPLFKSSGSFLY